MERRSMDPSSVKYLQHNIWLTNLRTSVLSIITGGGKWVEITIPVDPLYLTVLVPAEKKFWRCVSKPPISSTPSRRGRVSTPSASSI
jgi:hypothetical protein